MTATPSVVRSRSAAPLPTYRRRQTGSGRTGIAYVEEQLHQVPVRKGGPSKIPKPPIPSISNKTIATAVKRASAGDKKLMLKIDLKKSKREHQDKRRRTPAVEQRSSGAQESIDVPGDAVGEDGSAKKRYVFHSEVQEDHSDTCAICRLKMSAKLTLEQDHNATEPANLQISEPDMPVEPDERLYCFCRRVSYGQMVACDREDVSCCCSVAVCSLTPSRVCMCVLCSVNTSGFILPVWGSLRYQRTLGTAQSALNA